MRIGLVISLGLAVALGFACNDPTDGLEARPEGSVTEQPPPPTEVDVLAAKVPAGTPMMRNISNREYLNAVSDLLGVRLSPDLQKGWTETTQFSGFDSLPWTNLDTKAVRDQTDTLEAILDQATVAPKVMTCSAAAAADLGYAGCAKKILEPFATRAFNRPLTAAELASIATTFDAAVAEAKSSLTDVPAIFKDGIRAALGSILFAPQFLTRAEPPPKTDFKGERDLTAHEVAARVSFMLLSSIPDDELWATAQNGTLLSDPAVLPAQVNRLLNAKPEAFVQSFMGQWLDFRAYENAAPNSLQWAMWNETWRTLTDVVKQDLPVSAILKPGFTYLNQKVASHYGIADQFTSEFRKVPTEDRGGILQQGSWLSISATPLKTKPMHRGRLVQDRLLCKSIPPPDSALFAKIQAVTASIPPTATVKQRLESHRKAGDACFSCHVFMDPIGLGLEGFDQFGKVRTVYADTKQPVETDTNIQGKPFSTVKGLNQELIGMPEYEQCVSEKVAAYSLKRVISTSVTADSDLLKYLSHHVDNKAPSVREIVLRLVKSKAFLKVRHGAGS